MSWQKEFDKRLENNCSDINFYKEENNSFDDEYKKAMNIADDFMVLKNPLEVDFDKIKQFISTLLEEQRKEERNRIYDYIEEKLLGEDDELLKDLANIIFDKSLINK
ncbi:MAG: hypothetical protein WC175_03540 [Candidatus Dojkabacteria bacterium]